MAGLSVFTLFRMGLLHTLLVVGLLVVGAIGMWKLATVFPSTRARIAALLVFAASPLVSGAMSTGRLSVLVAYASTPWIIQTLRRAAGVETADPRSAGADLADGVAALAWPELWRRTAAVIIVVALATAFVPVMLPIALALALLLAVGTLLAIGAWQTALRYAAVGVVATAGAAVLNLPWITTWSWESMVGAPPIGNPGRGLLSVASFEIGTTDLAGLALALYVPVLVAIALARAWRLTWAVRAGVIVVAFGSLAVLADRSGLPFQGPEAGVLLAPVAAGVAIAAASAVAAFDLDVRGGTFGWRQPLGILASIAIVIGLIPGVAATMDGAWKTPSTPLAELIEASLPAPSAAGDYNVLLIGDSRILPVPATEYRDGISFAVIDANSLDLRDRWAPPQTAADDAITFALDQMSSGSTLRTGNLLAPLGIRRIIVPEFDGVISTTDDPVPLPAGLVTALENQLDLVSVNSLPTLEVFENRSWLPRFGQLAGATAAASEAAGAEALIAADLSITTPIFDGADEFGTYDAELEPGAVHVAVPFDENWKLTSNGSAVPARRAFGVTTAFDVDRSGPGELTYSTPASRPFVLVVVTLLWLAVLFSATRVSVPMARRRRPLVSDETLIDLGDDGFQDLGVLGDDFDGFVIPPPSGETLAPGFDPGLDMTGEIARTAMSDDEDGPADDAAADDGPADDAADPVGPGVARSEVPAAVEPDGVGAAVVDAVEASVASADRPGEITGHDDGPGTGSDPRSDTEPIAGEHLELLPDGEDEPT